MSSLRLLSLALRQIGSSLCHIRILCNAKYKQLQKKNASIYHYKYLSNSPQYQNYSYSSDLLVSIIRIVLLFPPHCGVEFAFLFS